MNSPFVILYRDFDLTIVVVCDSIPSDLVMVRPCFFLTPCGVWFEGDETMGVLTKIDCPHNLFFCYTRRHRFKISEIITNLRTIIELVAYRLFLSYTRVRETFSLNRVPCHMHGVLIPQSNIFFYSNVSILSTSCKNF